MKTSLQKFARFEVLAAALAVALIVLLACVHVPYAEKVITSGRELWGFWAIEKRTVELKSKKASLQKQNKLLDSLIKIHEHTMYTDENSVAATLYKQADAAGMRTSKIEVGERLAVEDRFETPVTVHGSGTYAEVGSFCEAIENLPAPARIRLVSAENAGRGTVRAFIDFVLLSQPEKGK
jgi:Tfp pilus assembly protein PilO